MSTANDDGSVQDPLNREPSSTDLIASFLTPVGETCYDRNHGPIQHISGARHRVLVDGLVDEKLDLSISHLESLPQHTVVSALQCAGNRRHEMRTRIKDVQGIDWFDAAILNAEWTGPLLRDVLKKAGVDGKRQQNFHVQFACHATEVQEDTWYGASIPLSHALSEANEVTLALKMNGETLTPKHGYPVRVIVPGVIGARSVKWLDKITVAEHESPNFYQQHDYKILPPDAVDAESAEKYWSEIPPMMQNPINAVAVVPEDDEIVQRKQDGSITVKGYAVPQGDSGPVVKVEVSCDNGVTWTEARLGPAQKWSWTLFEANVQVEKGENVRVLCRATDRGGNTQRDEQSQWNLRGVGYSGYESRTKVRVV